MTPLEDLTEGHLTASDNSQMMSAWLLYAVSTVDCICASQNELI